jgi:hypothetical protein
LLSDKIAKEALIKDQIPEDEHQEILDPCELHHLPEARKVYNLLVFGYFYDHLKLDSVGNAVLDDWGLVGVGCGLVS